MADDSTNKESSDKSSNKKEGNKMPAKYDPEISGPGSVMITGTTAMKFNDAWEYANSILKSVVEGKFLEKNGMCMEEYNHRETLGDWESPIEKIAFGETQVKWELARRKASFGHGNTE